MGFLMQFAFLIDWGWLRIGPPYIYINIDSVIIHLGPVALHWYGLMYVVAILVGFFIAQSMHYAKEFPRPSSTARCGGRLPPV